MNSLTVQERDRAEAAAVAAHKAAPSKIKGGGRDPHAEESRSVSGFDRFMEVFPVGNRQDRDRALALYQDNLKDGVAAETMLLGAQVYRKFCDEGGITGTMAVCGACYWLDIRGWRAIDPDDIPSDDEAWG